MKHLYSTADVTEEIQYQDSYKKALFPLVTLTDAMYSFTCRMQARLIVFDFVCHVATRW